MIIMWIMAGLLYLIINCIITISWLADNHYKQKGTSVIVAILLMLCGLPIMAVVFIVAVIISIFNWRKNE